MKNSGFKYLCSKNLTVISTMFSTFCLLVSGILLPSTFVVAETVESEFSYGFPYLIGGPVGCSKILDREVCATAPFTKMPDIDVEVLAGFAELQSSQLGRPNCVVITMRLWVDHKGYEGRECLAPLARAIVHIKFPITTLKN